MVLAPSLMPLIEPNPVVAPGAVPPVVALKTGGAPANAATAAPLRACGG